MTSRAPSDHTESSHSRLSPAEWLVAATVVVVASVLARLHQLMNADEINSDAAIVALQSIDLLAGKSGAFSPYIYGVFYQSSAEAFALCLPFLLFGATPLVTLLTSLAWHSSFVLVLYRWLRGHFSRASAAVALMPLIFPTRELEFVSIYAPRGLAIFVFFVGLYCLDRARVEAELPKDTRAALTFCGAALTTLSLYLDLYVVQLGACVAVLALSLIKRWWSDRPTAHLLIKKYLLGSLLGVLPVVATMVGTRLFFASKQVTGVGPSVALLKHNLSRFLSDFLPTLYQVEPREILADLYLKEVPQDLSVLLVKLGCAVAFVALWPWAFRLRRQGGHAGEHAILWWFSALGALMCMVAFNLSPYNADVWTTRYLAPLIWLAVFPIAVVAHHQPRAAVLIVGAFCFSSMHSRTIEHPRHFAAYLPRATQESWSEDVPALRAALHTEAIEVIMGQYWLAYRLGLLLDNRWPVAAWGGADRIPLNRGAWQLANKRAYVFHPDETRLTIGDVKARLQLAHKKRPEWSSREMRVGRFTLLIEERAPAVTN